MFPYKVLMKLKQTLIVIILPIIFGCRSKLEVSVVDGRKTNCQSATAHLSPECSAVVNYPEKAAAVITGRSPLVAGPGDEVVLTGKNFRSGIELVYQQFPAIDQANVEVLSDTKAILTVPADAPFGKLVLKYKVGSEEQHFNLFINNGRTDFPIMTIGPDMVCSNIKYYDGSGTLQIGKKVCGAADQPIPPCDSNRASGCLATEEYIAVQKSSLASSNIRSGVVIGGVEGILSGSPASCSSDGEIQCVANTNYRAAATASLAHKVVSGYTVAGTAGEVSLPTISDVRAAVTYGIAGAPLTGNLHIPTTANVKSGITYGAASSEFTGSLVTPSPSDVEAGVNFGADGTELTGNFAVPSTGDVQFGVSYGGLGTELVGTFQTPALAKVLSSESFGANGSEFTGTIANCTSAMSQDCYATSIYYAAPVCGSDGDVSCVVDDGTNYRAADVSQLLSDNIKRGSTIGGITGNFPSAASPLPRYSDDGSTTNTIGTDIADLTNFQTQLKQNDTFEFWDASGIRRTGSGDTDIANVNVVTGITFENLAISGAAATGSDCTGDGQAGCVTTSRYKSMDTDPSVISAWDIRKGKAAGGLIGKIAFYKNMVDTTTFNRTSGTGALAGADIYDTVVDDNGGSSFPTVAPGGWDQATGANWLRDNLSDNGAGGGIANDHLCNGSEDCVYKDRISGLLYARMDATNRTWENAITYCESLNGLSFGGYSTGWRLPTQKEHQQSYISGILTQNNASRLNLQDYWLWSATTHPDSTDQAWRGSFTYGTNRSASKTGSYSVICVR